MISTFGAVFLHEWHSLKIRGIFFPGDPPPCFEKIDPPLAEKKWTPSHGQKELAHLWYTYVPVSVVTELVDVKPVEAGSQAADLSTDLHRILQIDAKEVKSYVTNCV